MIAANLVGFVIGTEGISYMTNQIVESFRGNVIARFSLLFNVTYKWNSPTAFSCAFGKAFGSCWVRVGVCSWEYS